jgi:dephospho-CoA kinase
MDDRLVVGLAGMPGAGKSIIVRFARKRGYRVHVMGDVVREEAKKQGLEANPENLGRIMLKLREKEGSAVISKRCVTEIKRTSCNKVIVDGIRSLDETIEFRKHFPKFCLVAVHSSPETRFKRVCNRLRSDDSKNREVFNERDVRELSVGLGNVIAMAEYMIVNEGRLEVLKAKAGEILRNIEAKWTK